MTTLSEVDPTADIVCTLSTDEAGGRLGALRALVGRRVEGVSRTGDRLRIRIDRAGRADLETEVTAWATAEKACCAFFGFAIESEPGAITLEISASAGAGPTLDGVEWLVRAADRQGDA